MASNERSAPQRLPTDGPVKVELVEKDSTRVLIADDQGRHIEVSEWNARRIFGCLSLLLQLPLSSKIAKQIDFGSKLDARMGPERPLTSLGERLAFDLQMKMAADQLGVELEVVDKIPLERLGYELDVSAPPPKPRSPRRGK